MPSTESSFFVRIFPVVTELNRLKHSSTPSFQCVEETEMAGALLSDPDTLHCWFEAVSLHYALAFNHGQIMHIERDMLDTLQVQFRAADLVCLSTAIEKILHQRASFFRLHYLKDQTVW